MDKEKYDLKHKEAVMQYFLNKGYVSEPFTIEDISSGNMNYVYRVKQVNTGKSYILKYAAKHTRISEEILVSIKRISIEAKVLMKYSQYVPQYVPKIYQYDDLNQCILMEDYSDYSILRDKLNQFEIIPDFADHITNYLVLGMIPSINADGEDIGIVDRELQDIQNPLCETTMIYVFSEPFNRSGSSNDIFEPLKEFIDYEVYQDNELLQRIEELKRRFINKKQALIHGDLHTGSIFVNQSSVIVFDYEFAFYGPIGFDIGNLLANLVFSWLHAGAIGHQEEFICWVKATIRDIVDEFKKKFNIEFSNRFHTNTRLTSDYISAYADGIIHDAAAYAGVELIRRIIGIAHVSDMVSISNSEKRAEAERIAIKLAKKLIMHSKYFDSGEDFAKEIHLLKLA